MVGIMNSSRCPIYLCNQHPSRQNKKRPLPMGMVLAHKPTAGICPAYALRLYALSPSSTVICDNGQRAGLLAHEAPFAPPSRFPSDIYGASDSFTVAGQHRTFTCFTFHAARDSRALFVVVTGALSLPRLCMIALTNRSANPIVASSTEKQRKRAAGLDPAAPPPAQPMEKKTIRNRVARALFR